MNNKDTEIALKGVNRDNLNTDVDPKEDFYDFATDGWRKRHPIPEDRPSYGVFSEVDDRARETLREMVTTMKDSPEAKVKGTMEQRIADIYELGMDMPRRDREGAEPIRPLLKMAEEMTTEDFSRRQAEIRKTLGTAMMHIGFGAAPDDPDHNMIYILESGLGLGDRDYYLVKSEENDRILEAYREYLAKCLRLCGYSEDEVKRIVDYNLDLEYEIARHKMSREDRRDPMKRTHIMSREELKCRWPEFDWDTYLSTVGYLPLPEKVNVVNPEYMDFYVDWLKNVTDRQLKDLYILSVAEGNNGSLSEEFEDTSNQLDELLYGVKKKLPLWRRSLSVTTGVFTDPIGQVYVKRHFPESSKAAMVRLVENLREALKQHIENVTWMSDETKKKALEKLASMRVKIGYPDKWEDFDGLQINPDKSYFENLENVGKWAFDKQLKKFPLPVDKDQWFMGAYTVNAYYSPSQNEICFPAGILQPPYFDPEADDALNYGAIGAVIGHEMTHAFDDSGRKFNKDGRLEDWWQPEDAERFNALADKLVKQFDNVEVLPGLHANGRFTLGENIADQGGIRVALTAYKNSLGDKEGEVIDGFTPEQRFFLSYAGVWAGNIREEDIAQRTKTDPHSLGRLRVNETLRNIDEFFTAFGIQEGDAMFRPVDERVIIW